MTDETLYTVIEQVRDGKQTKNSSTGEYEWQTKQYFTSDLRALFESKRQFLPRTQFDQFIAELLKDGILADVLGVTVREASAEDRSKYAHIIELRAAVDQWRNADAEAQRKKREAQETAVRWFNERVTTLEEAAKFFTNADLLTRDFHLWLKAAYNDPEKTIELTDKALIAFEEYRTSQPTYAKGRLKGAAALKSVKESFAKERAPRGTKTAKKQTAEATAE